jgi:predicted ATP-grasp superfamily ATP-dependent carboligase
VNAGSDTDNNNARGRWHVADTRFRILLTEASSNSAREVLTVLGRHGHEVGVMDSGGISFTALSRWVKYRHHSPAFAADPLRYLDVLREVLESHPYDILLPTHEQLVALSRYRDDFGKLTALAVPGFDAVRTAQDKAAAARLFDELGLPQPDTTLVADERTLLDQADRLPAYVKLPVATSSRGVWHVRTPELLAEIAALPAVRDVFTAGGTLLVQQPMTGPLVMVQALFDHGALAGTHTSLRTREGVQGSASAKESIVLPDVTQHLTTLGAALNWHGPMSIDGVLDENTSRVHYIDLNPRLVEPVNAELAGADLVRRWLAISRGKKPGPLLTPRAGVRTHMLATAILRHVEVGRGRWAILRELAAAATRRGWYQDSREELLPIHSDPATALPLAAITACLLISPRLWQRLAPTEAPAHALTPQGWQQLLDA